MLLRFIGEYTNKRTSICMGEGALFHGRDPTDVPDGDTLRRLLGNPEFEAVDESQPVSQPRKRGRPSKKDLSNATG